MRRRRLMHRCYVADIVIAWQAGGDWTSFPDVPGTPSGQPRLFGSRRPVNYSPEQERMTMNYWVWISVTVALVFVGAGLLLLFLIIAPVGR